MILLSDINMPRTEDNIFSFQNSSDVNLLTATSLGKLEVYKLDKQANLHKQTEVELCDEQGNLALSVDVDSNLNKALTSDSKGQITLLDLTSNKTLVKQWKAHDFEAWTCAFDRFNCNIVFSGKV